MKLYKPWATHGQVISQRNGASMYSMKQACQKTGLTYDTLKFYCNEGLVPNVKRAANNYRIFDDDDLAWINSLSCLKNCGMSIQEMKDFLELCLAGESTIPKRMEILNDKLVAIQSEIKRLRGSIDYIKRKQNFYQNVLDGKEPYRSNLKIAKWLSV